MKLIELYAVPDTFCTALGRVDILSGGFARFVCYVERQDEDGVVENVVVANVVMPLVNVPDAILLATAATATSVVDAVKKLLPIAH